MCMADQLKMHKQKIRMLKKLKKEKMDRSDLQDFLASGQIKGTKANRKKTFVNTDLVKQLDLDLPITA